jgi:hypothetical protein
LGRAVVQGAGGRAGSKAGPTGAGAGTGMGMGTGTAIGAAIMGIGAGAGGRLTTRRAPSKRRAQ